MTPEQEKDIRDIIAKRSCSHLVTLEAVMTEIDALRVKLEKYMYDGCACVHDGNTVSDPCEMHKDWKAQP